jgi:hypothetical protein
MLAHVFPIMAIVTDPAWTLDPTRQIAVTPNDVAYLDTILIRCTPHNT